MKKKNNMDAVYGFLLIVLGGGLIWYTIKKPSKKEDPIAADFQGIVGGALFIVIGLLMFFSSTR